MYTINKCKSVCVTCCFRICGACSIFFIKLKLNLTEVRHLWNVISEQNKSKKVGLPGSAS